MNKQVLIIFLVMIYSVSGYTKDICQDLFLNENKDNQSSIASDADYIDKIAFQLSKNSSNLVIHNQVLYIKDKAKGDVKAADVRVIRPRYLFEYQDKKFHEYWMTNGGVSKEDIDAALRVKGQTYGRGFYVSLSATDSQSYGDYLTVFKIDEPLVVLTNLVSLQRAKKNISENEKLLNELRASGISGIQGITSWYTIISENVLNKPQSLDGSSLNYAVELSLSAKMQEELLLKRSNQVFPASRFMQLASLKLKKNIDQNIFDLKKIMQKDYTKLNDRELRIFCLEIMNDPIPFVRLLHRSYPNIALDIMSALLSKIKIYDESKYHSTLSTLEYCWSYFDFSITFKDFLKTLT